MAARPGQREGTHQHRQVGRLERPQDPEEEGEPIVRRRAKRDRRNESSAGIDTSAVS